MIGDDRGFGVLSVHTAAGIVYVPLTGDATGDALLQRVASVRGRYIVETLSPTSAPHGDAWEGPDP